MFIYFWERNRMQVGERGRERGRHRIRSRLQALSCQHRAQCGARTHKPQDHDLSRSGRLTNLAPRRPSRVFVLTSHLIISYSIESWRASQKSGSCRVVGRSWWWMVIMDRNKYEKPGLQVFWKNVSRPRFRHTQCKCGHSWSIFEKMGHEFLIPSAPHINWRGATQVQN